MHRDQRRRRQEVENRIIKRRRDNKELLFCLNTLCRVKCERHYPNNCVIRHNRTEASLMEGYRKSKSAYLEKRWDGGGRARWTSETFSASYSSTYKASFCRRKDRGKCSGRSGGRCQSHVESTVQRGSPVLKYLPTKELISLRQLLLLVLKTSSLILKSIILVPKANEK